MTSLKDIPLEAACAIEINPARRYLIFVDPCAVDMDDLMASLLPDCVTFIPVPASRGRSVRDMVHAWVYGFSPEPDAPQA